MRVIIAGGGTGGHIFPAISIAEEILRRNPENSVLFIGTREGLEKRTVFQLGYKLEFISSRGIVGKGIIRGIRGIASAFRGLLDSFRIISKFGPDVVLGVGGYVSGPVVCAAVLLLIPTAICEQNSIPGITNRFLGRLVRRVFASFEESVRFFPRKITVVVGNPVRSQILLKGKWSQKKMEGITILVFGGSQGARTLNLTVPRALGILARQDISIIHQTGEKDVEDVKKSYEWYGLMALVLPFIEDMASAYSQADLVIGRAGAGTLSEITAIGIPSILVPYPFAAYNHQLENARIVQRTGAAVIVEDKDVTPEKFAEILSSLLKNDILEEMAKRAKSLGRPDAAKKIVDEIYELAGSKYIATNTQRHQEER